MLEVYQSAPANDRARMERILNELAENGRTNLHQKQFRDEARYSTGNGSKAMVVAAKSYQLRIYGCFQKGPPRRLMCAEAAIKQTNKADQKLLKSTAKKVGE